MRKLIRELYTFFYVAVLILALSLTSQTASALSSTYFFLSTPKSSSDGMHVSTPNISMTYDIFSSSSSNLFYDYYVCPYAWQDNGNTDTLPYEYCVSFYMDGYNSPYGQYYTKVLDGQAPLLYPGINNISCFIISPKEPDNYQECGSSIRVYNTSTITPVYRFWSPLIKHHLFTTDGNEKITVMRNFPETVWSYEDIAFRVKSLNECSAGESVYRFYSEAIKSHLYTKDEYEKSVLIGLNNPSVWRYEGVAYCADSTQVAGTLPVYRFYSEVSKSHLFTIDENEKNTLIGHNDPGVWRYEGVAYYAYPRL